MICKSLFFVPEYGTIEGITCVQNLFLLTNEFLTAFGKQPIFEVEYVGLTTYVPANSGEYTIKTNRLLQDVQKTDLLIIPPIFGNIEKGICDNAEAIPYFTKNCTTKGLVLPVYAWVLSAR
jgi:hypothetical protein